MVGHGLRMEMRYHRVEGGEGSGEEMGGVVIRSRMGDVNRDGEMHGGGFMYLVWDLNTNDFEI